MAETSDIQKAMARKERSIARFTDAKQRSIITTSTFGAAASWVEAGIKAGIVKWEKRYDTLMDEWANLKARLEEAIELEEKEARMDQLLKDYAYWKNKNKIKAEQIGIEIRELGGGVKSSLPF